MVTRITVDGVVFYLCKKRSYNGLVIDLLYHQRTLLFG